MDLAAALVEADPGHVPVEHLGLLLAIKPDAIEDQRSNAIGMPDGEFARDVGARMSSVHVEAVAEDVSGQKCRCLRLRYFIVNPALPSVERGSNAQ